VGSLASPQRFVKRVAPLRYGVINDRDAEFAFFGGVVDGVHVGLIGSADSLVGAAQNADADPSLDHYTLGFLRYAAKVGESADGEESKEAGAFDDDRYEVAATMAITDALESRVLRNESHLEFLVRPLIHSEIVFVGTPINVAFAD
jgi:hypothetical protein